MQKLISVLIHIKLFLMKLWCFKKEYLIREPKKIWTKIFDNKWNYRSDAKEWISKLKIAIWIDWKNTIEEVNEISSKTQEFIKKYPLSDFKNLIFKQCIEHPFISNTWVFFNEYKDIKREVESLGKNFPSE